jgi:glycine oxidase
LTPRYNPKVSSPRYDAIIIGGGIIGLSLALELRTHLQSILVIDRGPIGREASFAAAGMLNATDCQGPEGFQLLARDSANLYPTYIGRIEEISGLHVDFQHAGALVIQTPGENGALSPAQISELEPQLAMRGHAVHFVPEDFVDPRSLMVALESSMLKSDVDLEPNQKVNGLANAGAAVGGVKTTQGEHASGIVVNCAGAWASDIEDRIPSHPMKGQMLAVKPPRPILKHVVRCNDPDVYMLPRESGTIAVGATVENVGFSKAIDEKCDALLASAKQILPALGEAEVIERWAGLRPATPDGLPIIGATEIPGYFVATGHYRNGILLAPATAKVMAELIINGSSSFDLDAFAPSRFAKQ